MKNILLGVSVTAQLRIIDIVLSAVGLVIGAPLLLVGFLVAAIDTGAPFFKQQRVGLSKRHFTIVKFRTMPKSTESKSTHLIHASSISTLGHFMRSTKLDELPQLWNVFKGEMSLVGPRPGLVNQAGLIEARERLGVFSVRPGITGLAQIEGIDMSNPRRLAEIDAKMINSMSILNYFKYISLTLIGMGRGDNLNCK